MLESICIKCRLSVNQLKIQYKKRLEKLSLCIFKIKTNMRSEPGICFRENQNKVKGPFLKLLHQESFFVMLHRGKNFKELDPRPLLTEAAIQMFLSIAVRFQRHKLYLLIQFFVEVPKFKMSKRSIKGTLEKLDNLSKSNSLRYMINSIKQN